MTTRRPRESQRSFVARILRADGRLSTYDALYRLRHDDGRSCSLTRLAAIVFDLRAEGWDIETVDAPGELATYLLVSAPPQGTPHPQSLVWTCATCRTPTPGGLTFLLGGIAEGYCLTCRTRRHFRKVAAA